MKPVKKTQWRPWSTVLRLRTRYSVAEVDIHLRYARGDDVGDIAYSYHTTRDTIEKVLERFNYRDWVGKQICEDCGEPPGERDRGRLSTYRGRRICHKCMQGEGRSDADWEPFVMELLNLDENGKPLETLAETQIYNATFNRMDRY